MGSFQLDLCILNYMSQPLISLLFTVISRIKRIKTIQLKQNLISDDNYTNNILTKKSMNTDFLNISVDEANKCFKNDFS